MAILAVAVFTIAFSLGIIYLVQPPRGGHRAAAQLHGACRPPRPLERSAYGLHIVGLPAVDLHVIAGAIWASKAWGSYWNWDPKEVWTFVIWVVYAAYLHARATAGWEPRKAMWIALAGYGCIIINFAVVNVFFVGQHSYSGC